MSLLLDALKQAERNKSQSPPAEVPASTPAVPSDPAVRLDSFDFEISAARSDKVEPHVAPQPLPPQSIIARAMEPPLRATQAAVTQTTPARGADPSLRPTPKQTSEPESERQQSAKQLFTVKQSAQRRGLNATWLAGLALCALTLAGAAAYFWMQQRGTDRIALAPLPAPAKPVPAPMAVPAAPVATLPPAEPVLPDTTTLPSTQPEASAVSEQPSVPAADETQAGTAPGTPKDANSGTAKEAQAATPLSEPESAQAPAPAPATPAASASERSGQTAQDKPAQQAAATPAKRPARSVTRAARAPADTWAFQASGVARERTGKRTSEPPSGAPRLQRSANRTEVHPDLAAAYQALIAGDTRSAAQRYQIVLQSDAFNLDAYLGLATIAAGQGERESARRYYRHALELDPNNDVAMAGLASIGAAGGSSESPLRTQLAQQPTSHHLHFALGNDLARQRRWPEAQQAYFNAYSLDPDNPDYAYNLAVSLDQLNQTRAALNYYERALQLSVARNAQFNGAQLNQRISELKQTN